MTERPPRRIRSYVLRQGRMTRGQKSALETHWSRYGVDFRREILDLNGVFGRRAPRILDVGSGMGEATVAMAAAHPENDYLAVEVHVPGAGSLIRLAVERGAGNIRVISRDVLEVLACQIPDRALDAVCVFFPDPWPKKRHHKRRLVAPEFLTALIPKMKGHGRLFLASDWEDMAQHMLAVCDAEPRLVNLAGSGAFAPRPRWRPLTKFEQRGQRLRHGVHDLAYALSPTSSGSKDERALNSPGARNGA